MENDLDSRQRNVIVNAYEARHAGSIEEGSEGEAERRKKVADDLGEKTKDVCTHWYFATATPVTFLRVKQMMLRWLKFVSGGM